MNFSKMIRVLMNAEGGAAAGAAAGASGGGAAAAPAPGSNAGAAQPPATPGDWLAGMAEEARGYAQNKGWKDPGSLLESYRNLEKLHGVPAERILKLPGDDNAEEWGKVYGRLGRPEKPEGYTIPMPKEGGDESFAKWAKDAFHGANLTTKQAEALAGKWNEFQASTMKAQVEAMQAKVNEESANLKREWGAAFEQNQKIAKRAAAEFVGEKGGALIDKLEKELGYAEVMKLFHKIGAGMGESKFVDGDGPAGGNIRTPEQAVAKIAELKANPEWIKRYLEGGINSAEYREMASLLEQAGASS